MTDVDLKNALLAGNPNAGDDTAEVKTHAGVVVVRPLKRGEVLRLKGMGLGLAEFEQHMVSIAMVSPTMTVAEVAAWQSVEEPEGSLEDVTDKISELSGLKKGADKSGVPGAGE